MRFQNSTFLLFTQTTPSVLSYKTKRSFTCLHVLFYISKIKLKPKNHNSK